MDADLSQVRDLTDAVYLAEKAKMQTLITRETDLRRALADLEEYQRHGDSLEAPDLAGVREIGADILWQRWITRKREALTLQLAQLLADKERMLQAVRHAFGKRSAARSLSDDAQQETSAKFEKQHQIDALALEILKSAGPV